MVHLHTRKELYIVVDFPHKVKKGSMCVVLENLTHDKSLRPVVLHSKKKYILNFPEQTGWFEYFYIY